MGKKRTEGLRFTTRYRLQGKIRTFIKELEYSIEKVSGFDTLSRPEKAELLEWKKGMLRHMKGKLVACYEDIVDDLACEDSTIFRLQVGTESMKDEPED